MFPSCIIVSVNESSKFNLSNFIIDCENLNSLPSVARISNYNYATDLSEGIVDVVIPEQNKDSKFTIHTPRVNLILGVGKFRIVVQGKTTIIAVLSGKAYAANLVESLKYEINEGKVATITTFVPLNKVGNDPYKNINNNKPTASIKDILTDDLNDLTKNFNTLSNIKESVIFSVIDQKIIGIKK